MKKTRILPLIIILGILVYFFADDLNPKTIKADPAYLSELQAYWAEKNEGRKNGYLQLIALQKLTDGENTFGSSESNTFQFDLDNVPKVIATIALTDSTNTFTPAEGITIKTQEDSAVSKMSLAFDEYGSSQRLYHDRINWQIVTRSDIRYLRVWDTKNPVIESFKGYETFEPNPELIMEGNFTYYDEPKSQVVKSEVDGQRNTNFVGKFSFEFDGKPYSLDVGSSGFTMVSDATTGESTYGGGRYVYIELPDTDGAVSLDFNKLYNPPCAFNEFTTCLYPPRQNNLPFNIEAGETIKPN